MTANLTITGTRFTNNSAVEGGAIASNSLGLVIRNSSFKGNSAENGGAIYRGDDRPARIAVDIANSTFYQNRANRKGGAIAVLSIGFQTSTIRHSTFVDNHLRDGNGFTDDITENILTRSNVYNSVFLSTSGRSKLCGVNGAVRGNVSLTRFCSPSGNNYNVLAYPFWERLLSRNLDRPTSHCCAIARRSARAIPPTACQRTSWGIFARP